MNKTVDVGLMANHLSAHQGVINRIQLYANNSTNQRLSNILHTQKVMMEHHVQVMNQLLNPSMNTGQVTLPPIPNNGTMNKSLGTNPNNIGLSDKDMLVDAHFTAQAMATDNFMSAMNMKDLNVKNIHVEMALQQSQIAKQHEMLGHELGIMNHPNATQMEQTASMKPMMGNQTAMMNSMNQNTQQQNQQQH
ncbi:hypothetical protein IM538_03250 [Cytobacillus suaedae]|nr:hypothetical protein IM538_03250 [Cytobacillus suaedae]